jgi:hypothetical protein
MKACASDARKRYQSVGEMHGTKLLRAGTISVCVSSNGGWRYHADRWLPPRRRCWRSWVILALSGRPAGRSSESEMALQLYVSDINRAMHSWEKEFKRRWNC